MPGILWNDSDQLAATLRSAAPLLLAASTPQTSKTRGCGASENLIFLRPSEAIAMLKLDGLDSKQKSRVFTKLKTKLPAKDSRDHGNRTDVRRMPGTTCSAAKAALQFKELGGCSRHVRRSSGNQRESPLERNKNQP